MIASVTLWSPSTDKVRKISHLFYALADEFHFREIPHASSFELKGRDGGRINRAIDGITRPR